MVPLDNRRDATINGEDIRARASHAEHEIRSHRETRATFNNVDFHAKSLTIMLMKLVQHRAKELEISMIPS